MPSAAEGLPSKNQVRKAGEIVRSYLRGYATVTNEQYQDALLTVELHRAAHALPMLGANVSLRRYCATLGIKAVVTQRLKRMETIKEKLVEREQALALDRMQDLGGCRAVVPTIGDVYRLRDRLLRYHPDARVKDYVAEPRTSGYRAIHVVAEWGRSPRKVIEVQLRSEAMHRWADMVERVSATLGVNYKQDKLNGPFQIWAGLLAEWMRRVELGQDIDEGLVARERMLFAQLVRLERSDGGN